MLRIMAAVLLLLAIVMPVSAQYNSRGDKRYRDRFERTSTYGDVVEIRLSEPGTLESKMPPAMENRLRLLRIEGPMNNDDFKYVKKLCDRSRCVDGRDKSVDNYIDLERERARIIGGSFATGFPGEGEGPLEDGRDLVSGGLPLSGQKDRAAARFVLPAMWSWGNGWQNGCWTRRPANLSR